MQQLTSEVTVLREKVRQSEEDLKKMEVDHKRATAIVEDKLHAVTEEVAALRTEVERFRVLEKG